MNKLYIFLGLIGGAGVCAAENDSPAISCSQIQIDDLKSLGANRIMQTEGHRWYLQDLFELPDHDGNVISVDLSVEALAKATAVELIGQLDLHTCQYKVSLPGKKVATATFKLLGE